MNLKQSLEKHDFHGVWMRLLALAMILIVAVSALVASPASANAAEVGDPSAVVFSDGHLNAGLEVRIGKIVSRLAFVGD